jgi:CubicO group peptidase (beta-lactamase class C family)
MTRNSFAIAILLLGCINLSGLSSNAAGAASRSVMEMRARKVTAHIANTYDKDKPGAAYIVVHKGRTLVSGAVGRANMEWDIPLTDDTVFRLGSMSKTLTAVAVLQLVEQDVIDLDVAIVTYAPDLPPQIGAVTMRQLMSHRSGLAEHAWNPALLEFIWQPMTTDKVIELQKDVAVEFPPGEKYNYVNFNYVVVANVIEKVTGRTYVEFINDWFASLNMPDSQYDWHNAIIPRRAEFYDEKDGQVQNAADIDLSHVSAAGALMSSTTDMAHWAQLLTSGKLISEAALAEAWAPAPLPDGSITKYGLGFNVAELEGRRQIWHNGLTPGSQGAFCIMPEDNLFVVILSNGFYLPNASILMDEMTTIMLTGALPEKPEN